MILRTLIVFVSIALLFHVRASEPIINLTLDRAIEIALQNHPRLAEAEAEVDAARARARTAASFPNPEAIARVESAPFSSGVSQGEYLAGIAQPIPLGGRLSAARKTEEANATARGQALNLARFELTRAVHNAFATALFSSEVLEIQTNAAQALKELVRITRARIEAGDLAPLDLARIQAEEAQHRLEVKEAARLHRAALSALAAAMGDFRTPIHSLSGSLADILQIASIRTIMPGGDHPAVALSQSEVETQRARLSQARAERIPDVNLDLLYRRIESSRSDAFDVGVRVPIPLFDRKKRLREAEHELRASEARLERVQNQVGQEQRELELALQSAVETAEMLEEEILPKTQQALAGAEARYKAGDLSLSETLIVRRDAFQIHLRYAETLRTIMEAWAGLKSRRSER